MIKIIQLAITFALIQRRQQQQQKQQRKANQQYPHQQIQQRLYNFD